MVGTTTVHPHGNTSLRAVELGGSIFVRANRHMNKAVKVSSNPWHDGCRAEASGSV